MSGENPHFGFGHGCDQCKLALILHKGCFQLEGGKAVKPASPEQAPVDSNVSVQVESLPELTEVVL